MALKIFKDIDIFLKPRKKTSECFKTSKIAFKIFANPLKETSGYYEISKIALEIF